MQRTVLMINIYLILTKFRDFKKYAKFNTRRPKIARKLNTRNSIPFFIFFQAWERVESPKSCNLIGSESRRYFTMLPAYHPRRPRGGQSGRDKRRKESFQAQAVPIGHNNNKHFLCPIRSQHSLDRLEMVRWVGTQGLFRPCLKTFVAPFNPARLTAPGSPRMPPYLGGIVGSFIHKFVCCLWMSKTVIFKLFFFSKLALLLALAGEKWQVPFAQDENKDTIGKFSALFL